MAHRIRKSSVRLGVAAIVAAVTGGVVLPATTAMAAPTAEVTTISSEVDPIAPPPEQQHYGPAKAPPNPYEPQVEPVAPPNEEPEGPA
ncbi:hypothetical protein ACFV2Z_22395, partial [Streptomyces sp. NPDC059688]